MAQTRHELLKTHIKTRIKNGHDVLSIKDDLTDRGVPHHEVHHAMDSVYEEMRKLEKLKEETERFLTPTKGKIVLPILLIITLILHFGMNVFQLPAIGDDLCASAQISSTYANVSDTITDPSTKIQYLSAQKEILDTQLKLIDRYKAVLTSNFPMIYTRVYWLNPFFRLPCETTFMFGNKRCVYYMSEENYECLKSSTAEDTNIKTVFKYGLPEYKQVSGGSMFLQSLILFVVVYLLSSLIIYYHNKFKNKLSHRMKETLEWTGVLILIMLLIFAVLYYIFLWRLL